VVVACPLLPLQLGDVLLLHTLLDREHVLVVQLAVQGQYHLHDLFRGNRLRSLEFLVQVCQHSKRLLVLVASGIEFLHSVKCVQSTTVSSLRIVGRLAIMYGCTICILTSSPPPSLHYAGITVNS
jgi:hypothetical protein